MEEKKKQKIPEYNKDTKELDLDELDRVVGGNNPFEDIARVKTHDYDQKVKDKI